MWSLKATLMELQNRHISPWYKSLCNELPNSFTTSHIIWLSDSLHTSLARVNLKDQHLRENIKLVRILTNWCLYTRISWRRMAMVLKNFLTMSEAKNSTLFNGRVRCVANANKVRNSSCWLPSSFKDSVYVVRTKFGQTQQNIYHVRRNNRGPWAAEPFGKLSRSLR